MNQTTVGAPEEVWKDEPTIVVVAVAVVVVAAVDGAVTWVPSPVLHPQPRFLETFGWFPIAIPASGHPASWVGQPFEILP